MNIKDCKKGMKVVCISDKPKGLSFPTTNSLLNKGDILTISKVHLAEEINRKESGLNFKEISYFWYPQDFEPIKSNIKKI